MFELLDKIRSKSQRTKKQVAFLVSLSFVGIIFVIWLTAIYPNLKFTEDQQAKMAKLAPSPTSAFMDTITNGFSGIVKQISSVKDAIKNFTTVPEHYSSTSTPVDSTASVISSISTTTEQ